MHAIASAGGSVFNLRHQDRRHCHHLHPIYQIHACDRPRWRLGFQVTAPRPSPLSPPSPDLSDPCMRSPPPESPFSSYGTKTVAAGTTFTRSIRSMHAIAHAGGSVFKLRHQDRRHCHHLHQIYQIHACDRPRRSLRFQVTAPRPSPLAPPSPDLLDPCMRSPTLEAPFSTYGTKTVATVTTFTRSIRSMHAIAPAGVSVFKLRHQDSRHCHHLHQIYQIHVCDRPRWRLRFQVTAPRPSPRSPPLPDL